jgi:hypothetical protein
MSKILQISIPEKSCQNLESVAHKFGFSLTEFLERLGEQKLLIFTPEELEDYLDLEEAKEVLEEAKLNQEKPMAWQDFEKELDQDELSN